LLFQSYFVLSLVCKRA